MMNDQLGYTISLILINMDKKIKRILKFIMLPIFNYKNYHCYLQVFYAGLSGGSNIIISNKPYFTFQAFIIPCLCRLF